MHYTTTLTAQEPIAITIGNFDGIHRGHLHLMAELRALAQALYCQPAMLTFSPHTLMVVRPDLHIYYLTTLDEKQALVKQYGKIVHTIVIDFTPEVAAMSAAEFMDTLRQHFNLKGLVVGENFSLGHNRMGNLALLERYGQEHDIVVRAIPLAEHGETRISSTRIRSLVSEGAVEEAAQLLGHPLILRAAVVHGDERGRLLGFPTANLRPDPHRLLPANGVYAVRAQVHDVRENGEERDKNSTLNVYNGVANIGLRPTFNGKERLVEVHFLDVNLDLYGKELTVEFIARLRSEQRFSSIEALKTQIVADARQARQLLQTHSITGE
jgi:riboflavin kinase/FMN adenylyltransferase